jgi:hypothetical protein
MKNAPYDHCDAPYIIQGLLALYQEAARADESQIIELRDEMEGELRVYAHIWDTTIKAAQAISAVVDFDDGELGVFAYEHCDGHEPGSMVHTLFTRCILAHDEPLNVIVDFATASGWTLTEEYAPKPVPEPVPYISGIQIQTTIQTEADTRVCDSANPAATHWSVYTRDNEGLADWVADFVILPGDTGQARTAAQRLADRLADAYGVYIEPIK